MNLISQAMTAFYIVAALLAIGAGIIVLMSLKKENK
jgi:hypothetical protein